MKGYEKLGTFYLGRHHDLETGSRTATPLLYDAKDLTTHAVCVGMTGSGKTGLCIGLLEEAAIDGIPAIVIDPKGDLGNMLLTFPRLRGEDFRPWVNEDDARRKGLDIESHASEQAALWRQGLAEWDQSGKRIGRLRESAEFDIYTPGSEAGLQVSVLSSFSAPSEIIRTDGDMLRERIASTTSSLLGLLEIDADPIRSREHILLSNLLGHYWRQGRDIDLSLLIESLQKPPIERIGVMELESFYPSKERFELAMRLNNLIAAPGFQAWRTGSPLDVQQLLYTPSGKPRIAIFSIAHLSDAERMFFVSILLNQTVSWMRSRPGTSSLRALLYMDEIFGYMPPVAEPPSKKPLLTLLKQARAYGLGVVLATQNPADLDYKGLSNSGTWFLGRLQTERDKARVMEGLEGTDVGASFDKEQLDKILPQLGSRVFLMRNVHEDRPVVFETRWVMSYLRGPLTRVQIGHLMKDRSVASPRAASDRPAAAATTTVDRIESPRPVLPPGVPEVFIPSTKSIEGVIRYVPMILGLGRVQYMDRRTKRLKHSEEIGLLLPIARTATTLDWGDALSHELTREDLENDPDEPARFGSLPSLASSQRSYARWRKELSDHLYRTRRLELRRNSTLGLLSEPNETEGEFRIRLTEAAREKRDKMAEALRKRYGRRLERIEQRIRRAERTLEKEKAQVSGQKMQTAISIGATILSAFLGRKPTSMGTLGRATTAMRGAGRTAREKQDVDRARSSLEDLREQLEELNRQLEAELDRMEDDLESQVEDLEMIALAPRRADVEVRLVSLAWAPHAADDAGASTPLWS